MTCSTNQRRGEAFLGMLVGVCFMLQQLFVPLHLALHAHTVADPHEGHALPAAAHGHAHHDHEHEPSPSEHEPHPAEDHWDQLVDARVVPSVPGPDLVLAPERALRTLPAFDLPTSESVIVRRHAPRPPPASAAAAPRAPPRPV